MKPLVMRSDLTNPPRYDVTEQVQVRGLIEAAVEKALRHRGHAKRAVRAAKEKP